MSADFLEDEINCVLWWGMLAVLDASTTEPMRKGNTLSLTDCMASLKWHGVDFAQYLSSHAGYIIIQSFRLENTSKIKSNLWLNTTV